MSHEIIPKLLPPIFIFLLITVTIEGSGRFYKGHWFQHERAEVEGYAHVKALWFNQTLDHFNPTDTRTWSQRYFVNDTFYKPGGPIFLMIGGEGEDNPLWMSQGAWITYAQKLNAYCFSLEHRFYGKSHPTADLSLKNLVYLTSEQALADLAWFTQGMNELHNFMDNKWVAFGGSYPGSLAAWYRMKYDHLVHAAISSSAPLLAQLNFKEYLGVVADSIKRTNPACIDSIKEATGSMEMLLKRRTGWWMLRKAFKMCEDFRGDNSKDVANLFETMAGNFMGIVQYNEDNRAFEGSPTANITISTLCDIMTGNANESTALEKYAKVNDLLLSIVDKNCTDIAYKKMIQDLRQINWNSTTASGERQWTYQTCNEFGFFQSSDLENEQPFGHDFGIGFSIRQCQDVFGEKYDRNFITRKIHWTNTNYGGKGLEVSRVIFINGSIDPWHALGRTNQTHAESSNEVIFIEGTAHCANMYPDASSDLPQLRQARISILEFLTKVLKE